MSIDVRETRLYEKILGSLLGGIVGDAVGAAAEGLHYETIQERHGWLDDFSGEGTDDTIMKTLLAEALIKTGGYAGRDDWAAQWLEDYATIFGKKADKFFISVHHTAVKLRFTLPRLAALGNLPSSSSAMCISPVGMVNACHPAAAAAQAYNVASLIHTHDVAFCQDGAAAVAAAVAEALGPSATVDGVLEAAVRHIEPISGREMRDAISELLSEAAKAGGYPEFRRAVYEKSDRYFQALACDSRETVPLALACFSLADGEVERSLLYGANFGRDADTVATMAGAIGGAFQGAGAVKPAWREKIGASSAVNQEELAERLTRTAVARHETEKKAHERLEGLC
jgi:ADP-ribosylglycohydrolase